MANFEFTPDEMQELNKLKANGYNIIAAVYEENGVMVPKCLNCQKPKVTFSFYAIDDNKKVVFVFSLCSVCLISLPLASAASKVSWQQLLDRKIDDVLASTREK